MSNFFSMDSPSLVHSLVTVDRLRENLNDPSLVVVDCRFSLSDPQWGFQQYLAGHIPGAYYLDLNQDLSSPIQTHGGRHPLPDPMQLAETLESLGIHFGQSWVVAYDDARSAFAARLWWLLRYLGHDRVLVLDGGWAAWNAAEYPIAVEIPEGRTGNFTPQLRSHLLVDIEAVKARKDAPGVVLVDSREPERYRGEREPIDPIAGHIPGAVNYPWQEATHPQGNFYPQPQQQERWDDLKSASEIIVYCGSGVTACVNLLSLDVAGISTGKLYAGSWSDWCSYL